MLFVYNLLANLILKICGIRILFTLSSVVEPRLDIHILQRLENQGSVPFSVSAAISPKPVSFGYRCKVS